MSPLPMSIPSPTLPWERPLGARPQAGGAVSFRVWAPSAEAVALRLHGDDHPMEDEGFGVRAVTLDAAHGDRYEIVLDGTAWPDPCSAWQPDGLRGPSAVVDLPAPAPFAPVPLRDAVLYELHVGTFTAAGTFDAAIEHLPALRELGVTHVELMPVAEFPGRHGWGYDGVYLSSAQSSYGGPDGLHRLVEGAHAAGLGVILDVVYNHVGASGNDALKAFGPYFTDKHETFWGAAINYDDEHADPAREWVLQSAARWTGERGFDGLRLDAIHAIYDDSAHHVVRAIRERVGPEKLVIAESGLNDPRVVRAAERGGHGCDAVWADDLHHALRTLATGETEGYYSDFGRVEHLATTLARPVLHAGSYSPMRKRRFGAPHDDVPPERFVVFTQNHDQVGNRALGDRLPDAVAPLAAFCILLSPFTPMLWQGEEYGERAPFQFFSDHIDEEIAIATRDGRRREFAQFTAFAGEEVPDPQDPATFERSKLTRAEVPGRRELYRALLDLRAALGRAEVERVRYDEDARWLVAERAGHTLAMSFAGEPQVVPAAGPGAALVIASADGVRVGADGSVALPALAGALLR